MAEEKLLVKRDGDFHYPIYFEDDFSRLSKAFEEEKINGRKICIVADSNTAALYGDAVQKALAAAASEIFMFVFPAGEPSKNLDTVKDLYRVLIQHEMDRTGILAALGGGVTGDLTGFGAATYLRGIDFIQIPTTLLAQVDSSVGGKTGVDFEQYKNMVGAFHQPRLVYMNLSTLKTLPSKEFTCGMGEVIKTGLICDKDFFLYVQACQVRASQMDLSVLASMVRRCCSIKAGVVERDPKEKGERALLNLGHTIGHAVEKLKDFQLLHGQCVGLGLVAAGYISMKRGLLTSEEYEQIRTCCASYGLPLTVSGLDPKQVLAATRKDKKMVQGHIKFIFMDGLGKSFISTDVTDDEMLAGIREICV